MIAAAFYQTPTDQGSPAGAVTDRSDVADEQAVEGVPQAAQQDQTLEFDLPESTSAILLTTVVLFALFGLAVRTSLRDSRFLSRPWRWALLIPRLLVLLLVLVIAVHPRNRIQTSRVQPSRVSFLIDQSLSMTFPSEEDVGESRAERLRRMLLADGGLREISEDHAISLYTFSNELRGPVVRLTADEATFAEEQEAVAAGDGTIDGVDDSDAAAEDSWVQDARWDRVLQAEGSETRLGDALHQLIGDVAGRTLSRIVVLTDGRTNGGLDPTAARERALATGSSLIVVGLGSREVQANLRLAAMQAPADVHRGDPFDVQVVVQSSGLSGTDAVVELLYRSAGTTEELQSAGEQTVTLPEDGLPANMRFTTRMGVPGTYEYVTRVRSVSGDVEELLDSDNQREREIRVTDRRLRVLLISSGPMRDYQFVRNALFRNGAVESDVWLQTVEPDNVGMVVQEAEKLLTKFPSAEAELFEYDVIIGFDPDWSRLNREQQEWLNRWVGTHAGGLIIVAGELYTPVLARAPQDYPDVSVLYPVVLNRVLPEMQLSQRADRAWGVHLTDAGKTQAFLQVEDEAGDAGTTLWDRFRGIYRSYPVRSVRDGASVLVEYTNPRARTEQGAPPWLAAQFYGSGRTLFLGSAETWRLRAVSAEAHQRFWMNLVREVGQGRQQRGKSRGLLLLDRSEASPGQLVTIRARLYDSRLRPLATESVAISIVDEAGRPVSLPDRLEQTPGQDGQYQGVFRPTRPGMYRLTLPVPESTETLTQKLEVVLSSREVQDPSQDVVALRQLVSGGAGVLLSPTEFSQQWADLFPDRSETVVVDERQQPLWDRGWMLGALCGLLGLEWLLRKLVRLS